MKNGYSVKGQGREKVKKSKEGFENYGFDEHRAAVHGIASFEGGNIQGRSREERLMIALRKVLVAPVYLAAAVIATLGWVWMLFEGFRWLLGA